VDSVGKEVADRIIPRSPAHGAQDNYTTITEFLRDVRGKIGDASTGRKLHPLRLEDKRTGQTYELHLTAKRVAEPVPGERVPGKRTFTDRLSALLSKINSFNLTHLTPEHCFDLVGFLSDPSKGLGKPGWAAGSVGTYTEAAI